MVRTGGMVLFVALCIFMLYLWVVYFYSRPTSNWIKNYIDGLVSQFKSKRRKKY